MRACVRAYVRACVRSCSGVCVGVCVCVCLCVCDGLFLCCPVPANTYGGSCTTNTPETKGSCNDDNALCPDTTGGFCDCADGYTGTEGKGCCELLQSLFLSLFVATNQVSDEQPAPLLSDVYTGTVGEGCGVLLY